MDFNSVPGKVHRAVFWSTLPLLIIDFGLLFLMFYKTFKRCKRKQKSSILTKLQYVILYIDVLL